MNDALVGSVTDTNNEQLSNALVPIVATEFGITIEAKFEQLTNVLFERVVNDSLVGSVTDVKFVQP